MEYHRRENTLLCRSIYLVDDNFRFLQLNISPNNITYCFLLRNYNFLLFFYIIYLLSFQNRKKSFFCFLKFSFFIDLIFYIGTHIDYIECPLLYTYLYHFTNLNFTKRINVIIL